MPTPIAHRHDILILFEVTNGNPNGDPDAGNQPRMDALSGRGLVSDVCLKRKVRNYVDMFAPTTDDKQYKILITQGAVINSRVDEGIKATEIKDEEKKSKGKGHPDHAKRVKDWVCSQYYDVRSFGAVLSTGDSVMKGSAYGQVRGPVQFTFGRSFDPITPQEVTITRCAVTKVEDIDKERTMGQKYIVPYALYAAKCYISPAFAENTGFDQQDYDLLIKALCHLFDHDRSAARGDMIVRGLYDFEHVGTQNVANADQNLREARVGCAHAHELLESIKVTRGQEGKLPESFQDYTIAAGGWDEQGLWDRFPGVRLHRWVDPLK
jgi:CRISPR-associated protein Csd2